MFRAAVWLMLLSVPMVPCVGSINSDWNDCMGDNLDTKIKGCSRIISDTSETQSNRARAFNYRANAERYKGMLGSAIADYDEAISLNPQYAFPHNGRGLTWHFKGELEHAIADFDEAISLNRTFPKAYNNRGKAWLSVGNLDRAISDFRVAVVLDPKYSLAYFNRGLAWLSKGELEFSINDFGAAITLDPQYAFAYFNRGLIWRAKGVVDLAIDDFDKAISLDPQFEIVYFNRALTNLYEGGGPPKALGDFNQARELDPEDPYFALWNDIVRQRAGLSSVLAETVTNADMTNWPAPILRLFVGQLTSAEVLVVASDFDSRGSKVALCEANFYSAMFALRQRREEEARKLYKTAADLCRSGSIEWYAANAELRQLDR